MVNHNRREEALRSLARIPAGVPVCVVDNASTDGTAAAVRDRFSHVDVVASPENLGAAGRTLGARRLGTPFTAFADDDSWWAPGAFERAEALFAAFPRVALLAARVLVGEAERLDPVCVAMRDSPVPARRPL